MADTKQQAPDLPVYLFTGFLEAGKTKFIQETLEDERFHKGERTLLLLCEEGEEVYEPDKFCAGNVFVRNIDEEADLTVSHLKALQDEIRPERVLVEYNGMWMLDSLYGNLPEGWAVAQEFLFCDATSFLSYNANMRQLTVDKLKSAELVVLLRLFGHVAGVICVWDRADEIRNDEWAIITARLDYKFHRAYGRKGPVFTVQSVQEVEKPEEPVATFY